MRGCARYSLWDIFQVFACILVKNAQAREPVSSACMWEKILYRPITSEMMFLVLRDTVKMYICLLALNVKSVGKKYSTL